MINLITFQEAREILGGQTAIRIDGLHYVLRTMEEPDVITLSLVTDGSPMRVEFVLADHPEIQVIGNTLLMREHHGDDVKVELFRPWNFNEPTLFHTAETAAAFMDSIHNEVCRQDEGSDSAYEELYEAATRFGGGFTLPWTWAAEMAIAARPRMEALWAAEDLQFIDCMQRVAQLFHNYITDPSTETDELTPEKAAELWEAVIAAERASTSRPSA